MAFSANCPACGAPVVFKSSVSYHGVCEFCRSTVVRHGGNLENLGRMADLLEDASPIQLGTEGSYRGTHFAVIGRIQLRYAAGVWNEWYVLFDDMRGGWLSDANGEYIVTFLKPPGGPLPEFAQIMPDDVITLAGRKFVVTDKEEALCVSGEGELPFAFGTGYPAQLVDLREAVSADGAKGQWVAEPVVAFASIDYSESPPLSFVGESMPFAALKFANLRTGGGAGSNQAAGEVRALQCPCCGGAITLHDKAVLSVACPSCLAVLEPDNASLKILQRVTSLSRVEPLIPLGSVGRFANENWTVIGFQERAIVEGEQRAYPWHEYLLHHPTEGFRWLIETNGHWNWCNRLLRPPSYADGKPVAKIGKDEFTRFSKGLAETVFVIGEFNWKVVVGETWETTDFIAPPKMLSREANLNETTWSLSESITCEEVSTSFKLEQPLAPPEGVGANQLNPRTEAHRSVCSSFWKLFLAGSIAHALWLFVLGGSTVLDQNVIFSPHQEESLTTKPFTLDSGARSLVMRHKTDLNNNWLGLNLTLVEKNTGKSWLAQTDVSYWQGQEDGENWSEGSTEADLVFRDLPPGDYYFVMDPDISDEKPLPVADRIRVVRNEAAWSNYFFLVLCLMLFPLFSRYRMAAFETERWDQADFAPTGAEFADSSDSDSGGDD